MLKADPDSTWGLKGPESEALMEAMSVIQDWKPESDVIALKYYMFASSLFGSGSAAYINSYYRRAVKLRRHAFVVSMLPVVLLPSVVGSLLHHHFVQRPLLLQKFQCPVCLELRGGMVQFIAGALYPVVLAPLAAFQFAARYFTYPLPSVKEPVTWLKEFYKLSRPLLPRFYMLAGIQMAVGMAITHWEAHNLFTVMSKLSAMEEAISRHQTEHLKET